MTRIGRRPLLPLVALALLAAAGCGSAAAARPSADVRSPAPAATTAAATAPVTPATPAATSVAAAPRGTSAPVASTPPASAPPAAPAASGGCPGALPADSRCVSDGNGAVALVRLVGRYAVAPVAGDLPPTRGRTYTEYGVELVGVAGGFYYAPARFTVADGAGAVYRGCLPPKTHPGGAPLGSGVLRPGQRVQGSVDFDVASPATLRLEDGTGTAVATWSVAG